MLGDRNVPSFLAGGAVAVALGALVLRLHLAGPPAPVLADSFAGGWALLAAGQALRRKPTDDGAYRALVHTLDGGFCIIQMIYDTRGEPIDYRFVEANPAFERQTGLDVKVGRTMREVAPDHAAYCLDIFAEVARTGEPIRFESPGPGRQRHYDVFAYRIGEADNRRVGILINDITERKTAERELVKSARHDRLTGLPNRAMFEEHLAKALARTERTGGGP